MKPEEQIIPPGSLLHPDTIERYDLTDGSERQRPGPGEAETNTGCFAKARHDLPSESTHWYDKQGNPVYEVPCSSKDGMRATTIKDARKLDLVPSVTQILGVAAKPGLEAWKARQILEASLTLPRNEGETLDDYAVRVMEDAKAQGQKARDKGTELHNVIEQWISVSSDNPLFDGHISALNLALVQHGIDIHEGKAEKSFASPLGYGGKIDFHNDEPLVIDFKTKERIDNSKQLAWPEHIQQLSAYGSGLKYQRGDFSGSTFRAINVFIGTEDKQVRVLEYEWPDIVEAFAQFRCLLEYWQRIKKFGPYSK